MTIKNDIELEKCKKPGCDVQAVNASCCGNDYLVNCNKCGLKITQPTSKAALPNVWRSELEANGQAQ